MISIRREFTMKRMIVVGDVFNVPSSDIGHLINESDVIEQILSPQKLESDIELLVEQGVDFQALTRAVQHRKLLFGDSEPNYTLRLQHNLPRAVRRLAHKAKVENICISYPRRISQNEFEIELQFSGQNELFLDHMTGFHIQGMALSEAARQAFLAVTEEFFLPKGNEKFYFVIRHQNVAFENFVFPFSAKSLYRIREHSRKEGRQGFVVDMKLLQAGEVCCRVDVSFTVFEAEKISRRERNLIEERASQILEGFEAQPLLEDDVRLASAV